MVSKVTNKRLSALLKVCHTVIKRLCTRTTQVWSENMYVCNKITALGNFSFKKFQLCWKKMFIFLLKVFKFVSLDQIIIPNVVRKNTDCF